MIETSPRFGDRGSVRQHANSSLYLSQITTRNNGRWLVVDTDLEPSRAPIDELDRTFGFNSGDGGVDIFRHHISAVQHTTSHVLAVTRVALHHLVSGLEASVSDLGDRQLFVVSLLGGDHRSVGGQREVDTWVRYQIRLEFGQIDVQSAVESERRCDRRYDLCDETVQVRVGGTFDVEITTADVVDSLVIDHERAIRVFQSRVSGQDRVVRFDDGRGNLRSRVDGEFEFGFLSVIDGQTFHQQGGESGAGTSAERVEDQETLKTGTLIGELTNTIEYQIDDFLSDGVVTASVIVSGIFFTGDQLFGVEQLTVGTSTYFICLAN